MGSRSYRSASALSHRISSNPAHAVFAQAKRRFCLALLYCKTNVACYRSFIHISFLEQIRPIDFVFYYGNLLIRYLLTKLLILIVIAWFAKVKSKLPSGDSGTRATRAEPELRNQEKLC